MTASCGLLFVLMVILKYDCLRSLLHTPLQDAAGNIRLKLDFKPQ
ncbi:MAG: hypothetical protein JWR69_2273 [Pedosphaera sp.]|nr:hypothetical protein [Pedosphaera sp.]